MKCGWSREKTNMLEPYRTQTSRPPVCLMCLSIPCGCHSQSPHMKTHDLDNLKMWCKSVFDSRSCLVFCTFNYKANIYCPKTSVKSFIAAWSTQELSASLDIQTGFVCENDVPKTIWISLKHYSLVLFHHCCPLWTIYHLTATTGRASVAQHVELHHPPACSTIWDDGYHP